ncbi:isoprenylcysteine carboxylmethyltransferase family protein [Mucilaginibacter sp. dw_454]|uniref:methyltransferase family protein n=1 Tax=Mucilaginibacter sp. dw_454 TaxID=2720079 RepID=UPI001BD23F3F|nr:isoprenylcysteine carboxylmethyltransferase family protein [Mucilaginibacter sp. dw_454]
MHLSYYTIAQVFGISEILLLIAKRSKKSGTKSQSDKSSLITLWVIITGSITISSYAVIAGIGQLNRTNLAMDIGVAVAMIGFIIRWTAILQLGKMFTVDVAITSSHQLKTDGLYKLVRHPSYLGLLLIIWSIAICEHNIVGYAVMIIPNFLALSYRINVEEKALTAEFGQQYIDYKKNTARLIPGIY